MLSIKNVHKRFGDVHAMNNINLDLAPGLFGLLGPNGAGKSTLMRTLATLQNPDEGIITYNGQDITNCLLYTSPSPRDRTRSRMPSSA